MAQVDGTGRVPERDPRPAHRQWRYVGLVAFGGTVGTALRAGVTLLMPEVEAFPVATFGVNVVGAFVLGVLLETLARSGPDTGRRLGARLFVGTGVLGGFTTYSALATATAELTSAGLPWWAMAYAFGTVLLGAVASVAGIAAGGVIGRRRGAAA
ncbi:fluoride efflux transporter FluC [Agromyces aerolatus]|uniref:fluoride efflux transporter FluC n=1 Tax=Agromyces sp. LY-1074 TaxID=3074080 RepID=UPI002859978D|nr:MULTISPECIES: CrcB family protein [unclassified Agromyces]MDR5699199.1 CrcB family protein [Agromyces sp. LY-1074]MDR5705495.1 CrcB family protein [Agromyces sp. LY-1358]